MVAGTSGGVEFGSVTLDHVHELTIDGSRNSSTTGSDSIQIASTSDGATGLSRLNILTGLGTSQVVLQSPDLGLPVAGGTFQVNGGSGVTSLTGPNAQNAWNLAENGGTLTSEAGSVAFSNVATLSGGDQADTFTVGGSSTFGGTLQGSGGGDTFNIDLGPETGSIHVDESSATGTNTLEVQSLNRADQLTDTGSSVASSHYATTYYSGPIAVSTSVITDLDSAWVGLARWDHRDR